MDDTRLLGPFLIAARCAGLLVVPVDLAEALGLTHGKLANSVRGLARLRKKFAQNAIHATSFGSPDVLKLLREVDLPIVVLPGPKADTPRQKFMGIVGFCSLFLVMRFLKLVRPPVLNAEFDTAHVDLSRLLLDP